MNKKTLLAGFLVIGSLFSGTESAIVFSQDLVNKKASLSSTTQTSIDTKMKENPLRLPNNSKANSVTPPGFTSTKTPLPKNDKGPALLTNNIDLSPDNMVPTESIAIDVPLNGKGPAKLPQDFTSGIDDVLPYNGKSPAKIPSDLQTPISILRGQKPSIMTVPLNGKGPAILPQDFTSGIDDVLPYNGKSPAKIPSDLQTPISILRGQKPSIMTVPLNGKGSSSKVTSTIIKAPRNIQDRRLNLRQTDEFKVYNLTKQSQLLKGLQSGIIQNDNFIIPPTTSEITNQKTVFQNGKGPFKFSDDFFKISSSTMNTQNVNRMSSSRFPSKSKFLRPQNLKPSGLSLNCSNTNVQPAKPSTRVPSIPNAQNAKNCWPQVVGQLSTDAKTTILKQNPSLEVQILSQNSVMTRDFRFNRVRIVENTQSIVIQTPCIA